MQFYGPSGKRQHPAWSAVVADQLQMLACERGRAPSPGVAAQRWVAASAHRLRRLRRLGWRDFGVLLAAERACASVGLAFGGGTPEEGCCAPWHLPERLLRAPVSDLPAHPLIDRDWLNALCAQAGGSAPSALSALHGLSSHDGLPARWQGLNMGDGADRVPGTARIAVCLHLYYPEMWPEIARALAALSEPWDLYISVPRFAATPTLQAIAREAPQAVFRPCDNRGRDVLPWLRWLAAGAFDRYDWVCKLHTKKSPHMRDGAQWRAELLGGLLGSPDVVAARLAHWRQQPDVGLAGPRAALVLPGTPAWQGRNGRLIAALQAQLGLPAASKPLPFVGGTMFWFRPAAVQRLAVLAEADFQPEMGQTDGTLAHAVERVIPQAAAQAGLTQVVLDTAPQPN